MYENAFSQSGRPQPPELGKSPVIGGAAWSEDMGGQFPMT